MKWIYAALISYVVGFALFPPRVLSVVDEDRYVSQALAFAEGGKTIAGSGIIVPPVQVPMISDYPPGTSLLQAPFTWAFGWRGAVLVSVISLVCATLLTAAWLRDSGKSPAFALLVPGFFAVPLFGRIAMSDMSGGALVALVCWLLWKADGRQAWPSIAAGAVTGMTLLFREPLVVLLAPLLIGAIVRRRVHVAGLVIGGTAGIAARLLLSHALFGDALYVRDSGIGFSLASLAHTLPVYAFVLLVMFPGGALLPLLYRGERRFELVAAVAAYVLLFLLYDYDMIRSQGTLKGTLLASRFMIPTVPLLAWMAADVWPRALVALPVRIRAAVVGLVPGASAGVALLAFAIHPMARTQERDSLGMIRGIFENTRAETPVITNSDATLKYLSPAYGSRRLILRQGIRPDTVPELTRGFGRLGLVLLDRVDSELFRRDAAANDRFVAELSERCELAARHHHDFGWASLRVLEVVQCVKP